MPERLRLVLRYLLRRQGRDRTGADIWDLIESTRCDPVTLIAARPELRDASLTVVKVGETEHLIIGLCDAVPGVKDADALARYMLDRCLLSLTASKEHFVRDQFAKSEQAEPPFHPPKDAAAAGSSDAKG